MNAPRNIKRQVELWIGKAGLPVGQSRPFAHDRADIAGGRVTFVKDGDFALRGFWAKKTTSDPATADNDRSGRGWIQAVKFF